MGQGEGHFWTKCYDNFISVTISFLWNLWCYSFPPKSWHSKPGLRQFHTGKPFSLGTFRLNWRSDYWRLRENPRIYPIYLGFGFLYLKPFIISRVLKYRVLKCNISWWEKELKCSLAHIGTDNLGLPMVWRKGVFHLARLILPDCYLLLFGPRLPARKKTHSPLSRDPKKICQGRFQDSVPYLSLSLS